MQVRLLPIPDSLTPSFALQQCSFPRFTAEIVLEKVLPISLIGICFSSCIVLVSRRKHRRFQIESENQNKQF